MSGGREAEGGRSRAYRWLLLPAAVSLAMAGWSLASNDMYQSIDASIAGTGGSSPLGWFVGGACAIVLVIGFIDRSKIVHAHLLSALMFLPSLLGLSSIDWLTALGFPGGLSAFGSDLPEVALLSIGTVLLGSWTLHRAGERRLSIKGELLNLGAPREEIDRALDRLLLNNIIVIIMSIMSVVAIWWSINYLTEWDLPTDPIIYVGLGLAAGLLTVGAVAFIFRREEKAEQN